MLAFSSLKQKIQKFGQRNSQKRRTKKLQTLFHNWVECLRCFTNEMMRGRVAGDSVSDVGPASVMVGNIVQGNRLASAQGRDLGVLDEDSDNAKKVKNQITKIFLIILLKTNENI